MDFLVGFYGFLWNFARVGFIIWLEPREPPTPNQQENNIN